MKCIEVTLDRISSLPISQNFPHCQLFGATVLKLLQGFLRIDGREKLFMVRLHPRKEVGLKQGHLKGQQHKQLGAVWSF